MEKYYSVVSFVGDNISASIDFSHNRKISTKSDMDRLIEDITERDNRLHWKKIYVSNIFTVLNR